MTRTTWKILTIGMETTQAVWSAATLVFQQSIVVDITKSKDVVMRDAQQQIAVKDHALNAQIALNVVRLQEIVDATAIVIVAAVISVVLNAVYFELLIYQESQMVDFYVSTFQTELSEIILF